MGHDVKHCVLGRKIGMTQMWGPEGNRWVATVIQLGPCTVIKKKTKDGPDGYDAVVIAYDAVPEEKAEKKLTKPEVGVFKKLGVKPHRTIREFRVHADTLARYEIGQVITTDNMTVGNFVDVVGTSKGRGFAGVMKRHNFQGFSNSHGVHESFRGPGTGGAGSLMPSRVPPGSRRPGHMGAARVSIQNLLVMAVDRGNNLLFVQGSVPGANGELVMVNEAAKTPDA